MNRNSKLLRKSLAVAGAVTLSLSMCSPVLAADVSATGNKLTITDVSYGDERAVSLIHWMARAIPRRQKMEKC